MSKQKELMTEVENDPKVLKGRARNIEMFKDWFRGMPLVQMAAKYGISRQRIQEIRGRDKWAEVAREIREQAYRTLSYEWKDFAGKVTITLKKDWEKLCKRVLIDDGSLTDEERRHGAKLLDYLVKANKLADEKPPEVSESTGTVTHRVLLPPGVKRWGVIPPSPNVIQVEHEEADKKEKKKLKVEDVGDIDP